MKKTIFLILLFIIPFINIESLSFDEAKEISNNYINNNSKNEIYLIEEDRVPFIYNDKKISYDNSFITGGLINTYEVNSSIYNKETYLLTGLSYWTIESNKVYENKVDVKDNDDSNIRVTEYVRKNTKVSGKGTYKEPWRFTDMYLVRLFSTDETMGKVTKERIFVGYLSRASFGYTASLGYKYSSNTCGMQNDNNILTLLSVTKDTTCFVSFEKDMKKITFDNNGGAGCDSVSIQNGQTYGNLCTPSRNNYTFVGWYTNKAYETKIESTDIVNDDITLYAKWEPVTYTLTYNTDGGTSCSNKSIKYGETYGTLCSTSKNGHTFLGWYDENNNQVTSSTIMTKDTTLTAKWSLKQYTLTYNNNGGSGCTSKTISHNQAFGTLCTPSHLTLLFDGWYTSPTGGTKITENSTATSDLTIFAHYKNAEITILTSIKCNNYAQGSAPYQLEYNGNCQVENINTVNWKVKFLTAGSRTLKVGGKMKIDIFTVGGGAGGGSGNAVGGGGGGYTKTYSNIVVESGSYTAYVAYGGSVGARGGTTYLINTNYQAAGGYSSGSCGSRINICNANNYSDGQCKGGDGGSGGGNGIYGLQEKGPTCQCNNWDGGLESGRGGSDGGNGYTGHWGQDNSIQKSYCSGGTLLFVGLGQGSTTREFGESGATLYSGGGAGKPGTCRGNTGSSGSGGAGGGGRAYTAGTANTGGGGGYGASGGSGIIVIRNKNK